MKHLLSLPLVIALLANTPALADEALVAKNKCTTCHAMDKKMMGPTWKDIAARHKGQASAQASLVQAIVSGSKGKYGKIPMPPQPKAKVDAEAIAKWIAGL
ncbi:MAG: c-type cytochrome [Pseudomonadota bacterium]